MSVARAVLQFDEQSSRTGVAPGICCCKLKGQVRIANMNSKWSADSGNYSVQRSECRHLHGVEVIKRIIIHCDNCPCVASCAQTGVNEREVPPEGGQHTRETRLLAKQDACQVSIVIGRTGG